MDSGEADQYLLMDCLGPGERGHELFMACGVELWSKCARGL